MCASSPFMVVVHKGRHGAYLDSVSVIGRVFKQAIVRVEELSGYQEEELSGGSAVVQTANMRCNVSRFNLIRLRYEQHAKSNCWHLRRLRHRLTRPRPQSWRRVCSSASPCGNSTWSGWRHLPTSGPGVWWACKWDNYTPWDGPNKNKVLTFLKETSTIKFSNDGILLSTYGPTLNYLIKICVSLCANNLEICNWYQQNTENFTYSLRKCNFVTLIIACAPTLDAKNNIRDGVHPMLDSTIPYILLVITKTIFQMKNRLAIPTLNTDCVYMQSLVRLRQ